MISQDAIVVQVRELATRLRGEVPGLRVEERPPSELWSAVRFEFHPPGRSAGQPAIAVAVAWDEMLITFGEGLRLELGTTTEGEAEESLVEVELLLDALARRGFSQQVSRRNGETRWVKAKVHYGGREHSFVTRDLPSSLRRASNVTEEVVPPWLFGLPHNDG